MNGLILDQDELVADWAFTTFNTFKMPYNKVVGVVDEQGEVVGAILFQNFNGVNIELSYFGFYRTVTPSIVRVIAKIAIGVFNVARLTVVTSKRNKRLINGLLKLGFKLEGTQRCYYGMEDSNRNVGVRLVVFRGRLLEVANMDKVDASRLSN